MRPHTLIAFYAQWTQMRAEAGQSGIAALAATRVLRLRLLQDGDVGIGVFPEGEEVLVSGAGFGSVAL
jgi:hypothetical protein